MKKIITRFETSADKAEFERSHVLSNIKSGKTLLYLVIIFEALMIVRVFIAYTRPFPDYVNQYLSCYVALLVVSVVTLIGILAAGSKKEENIRFVGILTSIFEFCILLWSIAIATLDSYNTEHFIVYLTVVVCVTSILNQRPWIFLTIEIGGFLLLNISLLTYLHKFYFSGMINLTVFTVIFVVISISKYNASVSDYYNQKKIEQLNTMLATEKQELEIVVKTDLLTGLLNRNVLKSETEKRIAYNYQNGMAIGIAMFDIDNFKIVNDSYGHAVGDECLKKLGDCFRTYPALTVYRYGGEEFLAICDRISEAEMVCIIENIIKSVPEFKLSVDTLKITISAGYIYSIPESPTCDEKMIKAADKALYHAKSNGKNCYWKGTI